ncbi:MAG: bile acid:sodium symporter [Pirellulales bacterium]
MLRLIRGQIFLVGLALSVVLGFWGHSWLSPLASITWIKTVIVLTVMSMMAAPVPLELFVRTVSKPWPGILASIICLGITPILGWLGHFLLQPELAGGLIVACCVPSTLASSAVMTRKAGGDDTVAIFVTIITNLGCVVATPFWLVFLMGEGATLGVLDLVKELALLVVLPIVVMQTFRRVSPKFSDWAKKVKGELSVACQVGILLMVCLGAVQMGDKWDDPGSSSGFSLLAVSAVVVLGLSIHLSSLILSLFSAHATGVRREQAIGVAFSASQKTLMIGINLAIDYDVSILPMIAYHVAQLLADALIAEYWSRNWASEEPKGSGVTKPSQG